MPLGEYQCRVASASLPTYTLHRQTCRLLREATDASPTANTQTVKTSSTPVRTKGARDDANNDDSR